MKYQVVTDHWSAGQPHHQEHLWSPTMEQELRPFSCETCDKKYLRKNNLEDHVLMEHPDSEQVIIEYQKKSIIFNYVFISKTEYYLSFNIPTKKSLTYLNSTPNSGLS